MISAFNINECVTKIFFSKMIDKYIRLKIIKIQQYLFLFDIINISVFNLYSSVGHFRI